MFKFSAKFVAFLLMDSTMGEVCLTTSESKFYVIST